MPLCRCAAFLLLLLVIRPFPSAAQVPTHTGITESSMPARVGTLELTDTVRYPDPRLGTLYRYRDGSEIRPDVYVYPVGLGQASPAPLNPAREEGMTFGMLLTVQKRQGRFDDFEIIESEARKHGEGDEAIQGWHVHAVLDDDGTMRDSHLHVYVIGDQMLKVRTTYPQGSAEAVELEAFVSELLSLVT